MARDARHADGRGQMRLARAGATHQHHVVRLTTKPSKQSMMGDRYTLPAGIWNSVMTRLQRSANHR
jgi:hypothetical protein